MSVARDDVVEWLRRVRTSESTARTRLTTILVGDRAGATLLFGGLCFFMLYWRVGVFITDTNTIANTLVALADGHLHIERVAYGETLASPGTHLVDGRVYGRNYGHVVLTLPVLWLVEGTNVVADLRVALAALWSLLLLGFLHNLGGVLGRQQAFALWGSALAVLAFAANLAVATPIDPALFPILSLQLTTMLAAALAGVFTYRLLARIHDRRIGLVAGAAAVVATPVGFWASLPKRHVITAAVVMAVAYALYRSRETADSDRTRLLSESVRFRALAYVLIGLFAWIHAAEAFMLIVALAVVDLPTAPTNDRRTLAVLAGAFLLSLVPFLVTNTLISGNPMEPPRLLPSYDGAEDAPSIAGGGGSGGAGSGDGTSEPGFSPVGFLGPLAPFVTKPLTVMGRYVDLILGGIDIAINDPDRLNRIFVRSGYIEGVAADDGNEALNMTLLEGAPVVAAAVAVPVVFARRLRERAALDAWRRHLASPIGATDCFVALVGVTFALVFINRLPLHAQVTVRHLTPVYPLLVYGAVRLPAVRRTVEAAPRTLGWTYAASVLLGGQLFVLRFGLGQPGLGEAIQFHAVVALALAAPLAGWVLIESAWNRSTPRIGAVLLGLTAGSGTVFLLLSGLDYFDYAGEFALPLSRAVAEAVTLVG